MSRPPPSPAEKAARAKLDQARKLRLEAKALLAQAKGAPRVKRQQRARGILPAGLTLRERDDGEIRPRWIPQPAHRRAGWKPVDLKTANGQWMSRGEAVDRAHDIAAAVQGWKAGEPVPREFAAFAPQGADQRSAPAVKLDPRSIGALLDAFMGVPGDKKGEWKVKPHRDFLAISQQNDRRSKLNRFIDTLAGYAVKPPRNASAKDMAAYAAARARARAFPIQVLEPPVYDPRKIYQPEDYLLRFAYDQLGEKVGENMAFGVMGEVSTWLEWCVNEPRAIAVNWAKSVKRASPKGRIRVGGWDELGALISAADELGLHSIGDSIVLGVDLSWSRADRLALTWPQIKDFRVSTERIKTGVRGGTPLLETLGKPRLAKIRERQAAMFGAEVQPTHVIIAESTRKPYKPRKYHEDYCKVRDHAIATLHAQAAAANAPDHAKRLRELADRLVDLHDQDLRDTAVTVAFDAGLDLPEIASRTLHSMKRIQDVLEKHYGAITKTVADRGARKLNDHLAGLGVRL